MRGDGEPFADRLDHDPSARDVSWDYKAEPEPVHGTYGLIWFLTAKRANISPQSFAVKTLDPERLTDPNEVMDIVYMRREFRMWLALPATYNVVTALGIDGAVLRTGEAGEIVRLPVMRMPRMSGSLEAWVGKSDPGTEDRLVALAQAFNGLLYLYEHGFEGHGDLKPRNILYCDLTDRFELRERGPFPSREHKWQVKIADLGWADAWVDLGFTNKALRQYRGPERLGDAARVVPKQSDVFAMGVIASELLQGRHPAPYPLNC
jgi:serine/threonine protein kinase